jgi:hypothetical protein
MPETSYNLAISYIENDVLIIRCGIRSSSTYGINEGTEQLISANDCFKGKCEIQIVAYP